MKDSQRSKKKVIYKAKPKKVKFPARLQAAVDIPAVVEEKTKAAIQNIPFLKKYESDIMLFLIPLIFFLIYLIVVMANTIVMAVNNQNRLVSGNFLTKIHVYPFVQNINMPEVSAKTAIVTDADSQVIVYSKNARLRFSMASTTKIMTALVAMEYFKKDAIITVQTGHVEGSSLGLYPGERFYFGDLLYAMLLPSANDAAQAIADNYPGGEEAFVKKMNEKAVSLHLNDTSFAEPTGLNDDGNFTTAVDLARLASYAIKNEEFTKITATKETVITNANGTRQFELHNLNRLLGVDGVYGIKTGTTEGAGEVLVTAAKQNDHDFIIVVMNSKQRFVDTQTLLTFIGTNIKYITPSYQSSGVSAELER